MCHTFKHVIHMQYFLMLTNLVIVFLHWVSTGVLYEPRQCSLFWDYIPESKLCFCVNVCRPSDPYSIRLIQKLFVQLSNNDAWCVLIQKQRCDMKSIPDEGTDEWRQNITELLENCVMNGFIMFGIMFMTATGLENSPQSLDVYTVSQSRSMVTVRGESGPRELASVSWRTPQWACGHFTRTIYHTRLVRKMAWYEIRIHVCSSLELRCVSLIDDAQNILN